MLLSSVLMFNSMGTIDENALNNMNLVTNLAWKLLESNGSSNEDDVGKYFPAFIWVLWDFSLQLLDEYKNPISPKQYLENALNEV